METQVIFLTIDNCLQIICDSLIEEIKKSRRLPEVTFSETYSDSFNSKTRKLYMDFTKFGDCEYSFRVCVSQDVVTFGFFYDNGSGHYRPLVKSSFFRDLKKQSDLTIGNLQSEISFVVNKLSEMYQLNQHIDLLIQKQTIILNYPHEIS